MSKKLTMELPERDSKSKRKRDMIALQKLGEKLAALPPAQLAKIPLDSALNDAIMAVKSFSSHEAKRRQMQYIGRLMRETDPAPLQAAIDQLENKNKQKTHLFHQAERWRDLLIKGTDEDIDNFLTKYTSANKQELENLVHFSKKMYDKEQKNINSTELFRYLRTMIDKN